VERLLERPRAHSSHSIDKTDGLHRSALMYAAARGRLDVVDLLLNKGARVDLEDLSCHTALHKVSGFGV
jgi:ankyrin repeat protein